MRKIELYTVIMFFLVSGINLNAQEDQKKEKVVFTIVEQMPEFPGGEGAMLKFLGENVKYPSSARENEIQGIVYVTFVVQKDGSFRDIKVLRGVDSSLDAEAVRVIAEMPNWKPGFQRGKAVNVQYNLPIRFTMR